MKIPIELISKYPHIALAATGFVLIVAALIGKFTLWIPVDLPPFGRVLIGMIGVCMLAAGIGWWFATFFKANSAWGVVVGTAILLIFSVGVNVLQATGTMLTPAPTPTATPTATPTPSPTPTPIVRITYPRDRERVRPCETVSVDLLNVPPGQSLWIVVYPPDHQYYLQRKPILVRKEEGKSARSWDATACFGSEKDIGQNFAILALLADEEATDIFTKYVEKAIETDEWRGVPWLPKGTEIYARVTVTRGSQ